MTSRRYSKHFQSIGSSNIFHEHVLALNNWQLTVFDDSFDSSALFSLNFCPLTDALHSLSKKKLPVDTNLCSTLAQAADTQDKFRDVCRVELVLFCDCSDLQSELSCTVLLEWFSIGSSKSYSFVGWSHHSISNKTEQTLTDASLSIITHPASCTPQPLWLTVTLLN